MFFEANYADVRNPARTGFVIFTMILSITVLVATTNYRLRDETEFLEMTSCRCWETRNRTSTYEWSDENEKENN